MATTDPNLQHVQCPQPLTDDALRHINSILQQIHANELLMAKCEACGIPIEQAKADTASQKAVLQGIKAQFFPHSS